MASHSVSRHLDSRRISKTNRTFLVHMCNTLFLVFLGFALTSAYVTPLDDAVADETNGGREEGKDDDKGECLHSWRDLLL